MGVPQLFVCAKSPATATELTVSVAPPSFVSVIVCGADDVFTFCPGKLSDDGDGVPCAVNPVPLNATGAGAVPELVLIGMVSDPERKPAAVGEKATWTVQLWPAGTPDPQEPLSKKSPVRLKPVMRKQPCPVPVSVSGTELVLPTGVSGNVSDEDDRPIEPGAAGCDSYTPRSITKLHCPESSPSRAAPA